MFFRILAVAFLISTPALAGKCYVNEEEPNWAVEVLQGEFVWYQGVTSIRMDDSGTGTGSSRRVAVSQDTGEAYPYLFHKGDLIFDNSVYAPAPAAQCK